MCETVESSHIRSYKDTLEQKWSSVLICGSPFGVEMLSRTKQLLLFLCPSKLQSYLVYILGYYGRLESWTIVNIIPFTITTWVCKIVLMPSFHIPSDFKYAKMDVKYFLSNLVKWERRNYNPEALCQSPLKVRQ